MRILVVGAGAREHALCWKFARESGGHDVLAAPGNPGTAGVARNVSVAIDDIDELVALAAREHVDLTVVGPEGPLALGLVDRLTADGRLAFGPTRAAARLETSKAFAKEFMRRHHVPSAGFFVCRTPAEARAAVAEFGFPAVLKADGLAAGKGVVIAENQADADAAIEAAMVAREFGAAGEHLVVEEFLVGHEVSVFVLCDGSRGLTIGTAQDHKRVFDDDRGPNTGGMGAFAPSVLIDGPTAASIEREIVAPVLRGMALEGTPFRGFLYVGLMLTASGPRVVEFNVRFGDPEAQVVIPSFTEPLAPRLAAAAAGQLEPAPLCRSADSFVGVVLASGGYPGAARLGLPIVGLEAVSQDVMVFHAGTALRDGQLVTAGGRVLTVVGRGPDYPEAIARAYAAAECIHFEGRHFRRDIGRKAASSRV